MLNVFFPHWLCHHLAFWSVAVLKEEFVAVCCYLHLFHLFLTSHVTVNFKSFPDTLGSCFSENLPAVQSVISHTDPKRLTDHAQSASCYFLLFHPCMRISSYISWSTMLIKKFTWITQIIYIYPHCSVSHCISEKAADIFVHRLQENC